MITKRKLATIGGVSLATATVVAIAAMGGQASANAHDSLNWTSIPANSDTRGIAKANALSSQLIEYPVAQGSMPLENPDGVVGYYGYNNNGSLVPDPTIVQAPGHNIEAKQ